MLIKFVLFDKPVNSTIRTALMAQNQAQTATEQQEAEEVFGFSIDDLQSDALAAVQNPHVRESILRVKQGQVKQGFVHGFDKAYHSHAST